MTKLMRASSAIIAAILAVIMTVLFTGSAMADGTETGSTKDSVIDTEATGSIIIHKIIENDGTMAEAYGNPEDGITGAVPLDNIGYQNVRIASISNVTGVLLSSKDNEFDLSEESSAVSAGTYFKIDDNFSSLLNGSMILPEATYIAVSGSDHKFNKDIYKHKSELEQLYSDVVSKRNALKSADITSVDSGSMSEYTSALEAFETALASWNVERYYTAENLEKAMQELITTRGEEKLNKWVSENASRYYYTDSDGIASMTELELGLYLVAETDITKHDGIFGDMHFGMNYNSETGQWTGQLSTGGGSINHTPAIGQETKKAYAVGEYYREMGSADKEAPVIESLSAPFLVSVPMTNAADTDKSSGTKWQYTVDVFPKNQTTSVHKRIIDPDEASGQETLRLTEDFQEGDMIEEVIWSDVPALLPNYYSEDIEHPDSMNRHIAYTVADIMSDTMIFDELTQVVIIPSGNMSSVTDKSVSEIDNISYFNSAMQKEGSVILSSEDYELRTSLREDEVSYADDRTFNTLRRHGFAVELTEQGLEKLNAQTEKCIVMVRFRVHLSSSAKIGTAIENTDYPGIIYQNSNSSKRKVFSSRVGAYTYEIKMKKNGLNDASNAKFIAKRLDLNDLVQAPEKDNTGLDYMRFVKESDGVYHVWFEGSEEQYETSTVNGKEYTTLTPASDGTLRIKGLDADRYEFQEIATETGKNLLLHPFTISLKAPLGTVQVTENDTETEVLIEKKLGSLGDCAVMIDGAEEMYIEVGFTGMDETDKYIPGTTNEINKGIAGFEITNNKVVALRTGGHGRGAYIAAGAAFLGICAAVLLAALYRRKRRETEYEGEK